MIFSTRSILMAYRMGFVIANTVIVEYVCT